MEWFVICISFVQARLQYVWCQRSMSGLSSSVSHCSTPEVSFYTSVVTTKLDPLKTESTTGLFSEITSGWSGFRQKKKIFGGFGAGIYRPDGLSITQLTASKHWRGSRLIQGGHRALKVLEKILSIFPGPWKSWKQCRALKVLKFQ